MDYQLFKDTLDHLEAAHDQAAAHKRYEAVKVFDDAIMDFMAQNTDHAERYYDEIEEQEHNEATE